MNDFDSSPAPAYAVRLVARRASAAVCGFGAVALAFFLVAALGLGLGLSARGATVSFTMTNQITGLPDTNFIRVFPVNPHANADGSYVTAGLPVRIQPNASGVYVWTNMLAGTYLATNAFIVGNYSGVGLPGSSQGILFNVDNSTNTYPFTRYLRGGYNVYNWYLGIQGLFGTNGISVTNNGDGSWTIDAGGFSPTISFASVTNALGFLPLTPAQVTNVVLTLASTNSGISAASATNIANGVYSNNAAGYLVSVPVGATNQFAGTNQFVSGTNAVATNALAQLAATNAALVASVNALNVSLLATIAASSNLLNNIKQPASLNLTNWSAIGTNQFAGTNFAGVAAHGILNSNDWQSFSARQPASGNLTNWSNLPTNALPRFVDVTNIASQYAGTASNAIGNAAGLGTNTTLVNAISVSVTNLAAQNATNGNERVTNLTVSVETVGTNTVTKLIVGNDANFGGFNVTNVNYIYLNGNNPHGTIIAGQNAGNTIVDAPPASGILLGQNNTITDSTGTAPTSSGILFGQRNTVQNELQNSAIFAGESNTISGTFSNTKIDDVILGGKKNTAIGNFDTVAGVNAAANHDNVFIWSSGNFATSAVAASVVFYPSNGFSINTNNAGTNGLRVAGNVDSTVGFSINGVPISQTAGSVAAGTNVTVQTNGTSYTVNAASQTNNFTTIVYSNASAFLQTNALPGLTNGLVANLGGQATNLTASGLLQVGGGQTFLITTNILGITNGIAQGTYQLMAGTWSNLNNATWTLAASAGTYYVYSNGVAYYSSASLTGTYSVVGGAPAPAPSVFLGFLMQGNGGIFGGYVTSTNLTAQIASAINATNTSAAFTNRIIAIAAVPNVVTNNYAVALTLKSNLTVYGNLIDVSNNTALDINNRLLYDTANAVSGDFDSRLLFDFAFIQSLDWANRTLNGAWMATNLAGSFSGDGHALTNLADTAISTNFMRLTNGVVGIVAGTNAVVTTVTNSTGKVVTVSGAVSLAAVTNLITAATNAYAVTVTNIANSLIGAQSLTPGNVNTNLFIGGVSQEGIYTNKIVLNAAGDTNYSKVFDWNATFNRWTNGVYSVTNAISAGNYRALDGSGSIYYFRTNSPQGTWQASLGTAPAPAGDWGRISDFGPGGNASAYFITNLITGPAIAAAGGVTNRQTSVVFTNPVIQMRDSNLGRTLAAKFGGPSFGELMFSYGSTDIFHIYVSVPDLANDATDIRADIGGAGLQFYNSGDAKLTSGGGATVDVGLTNVILTADDGVGNFSILTLSPTGLAGNGAGLTNLTLPALNYVASTNGTSVGQTLYGNGGKTNWLQLTSVGAVYTNAGSGNNAIIHGTGVQFGTSNNAVVSQFFNSATGAVVNAMGAGITNTLWLPTNAGPVLTLNGVGILTSNSSLTGANVTGTVGTAGALTSGASLTNIIIHSTGLTTITITNDGMGTALIYSTNGVLTVGTNAISNAGSAINGIGMTNSNAKVPGTLTIGAAAITTVSGNSSVLNPASTFFNGFTRCTVGLNGVFAIQTTSDSLGSGSTVFIRNAGEPSGNWIEADNNSGYSGLTNVAVLKSLAVSNLLAAATITLNTNTLIFTGVSALTNTLGFDATASLSAGTSVVIQDRNGNAIDTIGTVATLHVLVPLRANMRLTGTGISATLY